MKSQKQQIASERYRSFKRGWLDGAYGKNMDLRFVEHKTRFDLKREYEAGYAEGRLCFAGAMDECAKRLGHDQQSSILRSSDVPEDYSAYDGFF
jgi:hypothetical protein